MRSSLSIQRKESCSSERWSSSEAASSPAELSAWSSEEDHALWAVTRRDPDVKTRGLVPRVAALAESYARARSFL